MIGDDYVSVAQRKRQEYEKRQQRRRMKRQIRAFFQSIPDKIRRVLTMGGRREEALRTDDGPLESQGNHEGVMGEKPCDPRRRPL